MIIPRFIPFLILETGWDVSLHRQAQTLDGGARTQPKSTLYCSEAFARNTERFDSSSELALNTM